MDFLQALKAHRGGLIRLTELYWYDGRGWDGVLNRICLILDASADVSSASRPEPRAGAAKGEKLRAAGVQLVAVLLLIDGCPQWIWVAKADVELIT